MCLPDYYDTTVIYPAFEELGCYIACGEYVSEQGNDTACTSAYAGESNRALNVNMGEDDNMDIKVIYTYQSDLSDLCLGRCVILYVATCHIWESKEVASAGVVMRLRSMMHLGPPCSVRAPM